MKVQYKFGGVFLAVILSIFAGCANISAQSFTKDIKLLESTCEDVKRALEIDACRADGVYTLKDFVVQVTLTTGKREKHDKVCYELPAGKVRSFSVTYLNKLVPLADFGSGLKFIGKLKGTGYDLYSDEENGVRIFAMSGYVTTVSFGITPAQLQKYAADCRSGKK